MRFRVRRVLIAMATAIGALALVTPATAQAPARTTKPWVMPRTADGRPDLQGNWTNATITPIERPRGQNLVLTAEQAAEIEGSRKDFIEENAQPSDPDRVAPPVGGDGSTGAAGGVGGYNYFWIDAGDRVAIVNGEFRSSLVTDPADGRIPPLTPEAQRLRRDLAMQRSRFGEYDNPENRPLGERCIMSFGTNAGPPMLSNYFYNNNYTIVQTTSHIMIMTEMVHDVRIIRMGERKPLPQHLRPWMGDSWGRWAGDTLVVETTNLPLEQINAQLWLYPGGSANMRVVERFTRADEHTINYEFTVDDPDHYTGSWGGQVPFTALGERVYEYACHEANYALSNVLSGARAEERRAADKKPR